MRRIIGGLVVALALATVVVFMNCRSGHDDGAGVADPTAVGGDKTIQVRPADGDVVSTVARGAKRPNGLRSRNDPHRRHAEMDGTDGDELSPAERRLMDAIEKGRDDDDLDSLVKIIPDVSSTTNGEIRSELVDALGWFGVPAMNHLLPFLADPDDDVRQSAIDSWTSSLGEVEDEKMKARLITAVMQVLNDEDALESMATELTDMDEKLALQVLVDVIEGGKASKQAVAAAKEQYEFLTGDEYTTVEDADKWLAENYEQPDKGNAANSN